MKFVAVFLLAVLGLQLVSADQICNCRMGALSRILNGNPTRGHLPWLVLIKHKGRPVGSGFLLTRDRVLTAASVVSDISYYGDVSVVAGVANLFLYSPLQDERKANHVISHPDFSAYRIDNGSDAAIIKLQKPFDLQRGKIELACLELNFKKTAKPQKMSCIGYGVTKENGKRQHSYVARYALYEQVMGVSVDGVIAGKPVVENTTVCDLDYGAPLHLTSSGLTKVIGLASYSEGGIDSEGNVSYCSGETYFTSLSSIKQFVVGRIGKNHC